MRKYEVLRKDVEIKYAERKSLKPGCAVGALDVVPETIGSFDTPEEAEKELFWELLQVRCFPAGSFICDLF